MTRGPMDFELEMQLALRDTHYKYVNASEDSDLMLELDAKGFWGVMAEAAMQVSHNWSCGCM